jgi:hypothetical protein
VNGFKEPSLANWSAVSFWSISMCPGTYISLILLCSASFTRDWWLLTCKLMHRLAVLFKVNPHTLILIVQREDVPSSTPYIRFTSDWWLLQTFLSLNKLHNKYGRFCSVFCTVRLLWSELWQTAHCSCERNINADRVFGDRVHTGFGVRSLFIRL